jgi:ATPase subunit of ABC transporter with duplicated ATPase domains
MLSINNLELAVGGRILLSETTFQVRPGDRIGLVGRNGAGKTTLCRTLAGETLPSSGTVQRAGSVAYLPQDPRTGDLEVTARDRVLSARGLDQLHRELQELAHKMGSEDDAARDRAMERYASVEGRFESLGGWAAGSEAATIISSLGLEDRVLDQPLSTLSGGQRRRVELARVLFSGSGTLLLDEPTNHLDADSISWLRGFLRSYEGGFIVISHDTELLEAVVNRVFHVDAERSVIEIYNLGWTRYLAQRDQDDRRRVKERDNATRKADSMLAQANKMRARATGARAAQNLDRRRAALLAGVEDVRRSDRVAKLRFPEPAPAGRTPLQATGLTRRYGSLEIFSAVDLAIDRGSRVVVLGLNGAGKTTLLRILAGVDEPDAGEVIYGHGLRLGYYAQEHETLDPAASVFSNLRRVAPAAVTDVELRRVLGAFLFSGDRVDQLAGTLSGGEKTRLALAGLVVSGANVLLLDEPTNNLDPASRKEVLAALEQYAGAIVLVTHDPGAVDALSPDRVLLLPDGTEDQWNDAFSDLVSLA